MNFQIITFKEFLKTNKKKELLNILSNLWNEEYGFIFPISYDLMNRNTYQTKGFLEENSYVAICDEMIVGFVTSKIWTHEIEVESYKSTGWISLIYVHPKFRKKGIGSELLIKVESNFKILGKKELYVGRDYQNFFPGIPMDLKSSLGWFAKRGYSCLYETNDLIKYVKNNEQLIALRPFKDGKKYEIRLSNQNDFDVLIEFMRRNYPGRWLVEVNDCFDLCKSNYFLCFDENNHLCGFCRFGNNETDNYGIGYSLTWRNRFESLGGIGPIGVEASYRKNNIAYNLLVSALNYLIEHGSTEIIIDWTNLMDLYRKIGFEIWKSYTYVRKE